ncbi:MAG TPA: hypothetical protein DCY20_03805 [Firmicutes bacterium]|nr:hypothetical protein [Bacillota bacterium]
MAGLQIRIELEELGVWRRLIVPSQLSFHALHHVIMSAMGWGDAHLYQFELEHKNLMLLFDQEEIDQMKELEDFTMHFPGMENHAIRQVDYRLSQNEIITDYLSFAHDVTYIYDLGDYWKHRIVLEKYVPNYRKTYPICVYAHGVCPPEDCGGVGGYLELLEVLKDPNDEEFDSVFDWLNGMEYNSDLNIKEINKTLAKVCKGLD